VLGSPRHPTPRKATPKPAAQTEPVPNVKVEPRPEANADVATLMNTTLGDVLLAGLAKDPESVGRIAAAAITESEAGKAPADAKPDANAEPQLEATAASQPDHKAEPMPEAEAKTPHDLTPKTAN